MKNKDSLTCTGNLAALLIRAACENVGYDYIETSSKNKSVFTFPAQTYPVAMEVLRFATKCAVNSLASDAIAKKVKFTR